MNGVGVQCTVWPWPFTSPKRGMEMPLYERRPLVGLNPHSPQKWHGMRTEPPMSVPMPSGEPRAAISAPSPPEEPPAVRRVSYALLVVP